MDVKTAILYTMGPSTLLLAQYLGQHHDWYIDRVEQRTSMRGIIVARHETPELFAGVGINDGTRIERVELPDEAESPE